LTFAIEILPAARRELEALDTTVRRRIDRKIALLAANPRTSGSKKLEGHDLMRVRVGSVTQGRETEGPGRLAYA